MRSSESVQPGEDARMTPSMASPVNHAVPMENLPAAFYTCDADGFIVSFNEAAANLWGRRPVPGIDRWCGSHALGFADGSELPLLEGPVATTLRNRESASPREIRVIRPDGSSRPVWSTPALIHDSAGRITGALNLLVELPGRDADTANTSPAISENPSPVIGLDRQNRVVFGNPAAIRMLAAHGLAPGSVIPEAWSVACQDISVGNPSSRFEVESCGLFYSVRAVRSAADDSIQLYFEDVTKYKQTEADLRLTELKFRFLATEAPVGIFQSAPDGRALFVNEKWCEMAGMSAAEALGTGWLKALHPEDRLRVTSAWNDAVTGHAPSTSEFRFLKPDGSVTWVQGGALPLQDAAGGFNGYIGSCVDISDRKKSGQILEAITAESERKRRLYDGILSTTPDLAYVFDRNHRFIYANPALLEMWGRTFEESIGKTCLEVGYEPWHAAMHGREIDEVIATRQPLRGEVKFPHDKKGIRVYDYIFSPVLGADGEVEMVAGTTRDVTERKHVTDRAVFLSSLGGDVVNLADERDIVEKIVAAVCKQLRADACHFIESTEGAEHLAITGSRYAGVAEELDGPVSTADLGGQQRWNERFASPQAVDNVRANALTSSFGNDFLRHGIRSYASHPFKVDGRRTVVIMVTSSRPRPWADWERDLLGHVIERFWPLIERVRSELALRESKLRLRLVSDHVASLISHLDENEVFRFANRKFEEWFGIDPDKLVGTPLCDLLDDEIMAQRRPFIDKVLSGESVAFEGVTIHQKLGRRDMHVAYDPDFGPDGKVRGFYMMSLDITERKKAEQLLERRANHSKILWEAAGIILTADEPDEMLQKVFAKINELLEVDAFLNFMVTADQSALELVSSQGITSAMRENVAKLEFGQAICGAVARDRQPIVRECIQSSEDPMVQLVKSNGFRAYACNPLVAGDRLLGTLSFASSTRERFEADEIEFMQTVSHYVTGAYVRLQLLENLRVADRRKDEFLATLAHELRNPLAPIRTGLEIMKMNGGQSPADMRIRTMMERQVEQLITLVNDLLDVSRITRGKLELRKSKVDLAESVRSATEASLPEISQSGQTLEVNLPADPVFLDADPHRLAQVISNLLNNASRYSERNGAIRLDVVRESGTVLLTVTDHGIGIHPGMLRQIFEMFTQVSTEGRQNGGLGIGLTLVKSLAEMHGGKVWAESPGIGQGSSFHVRLPVSNSAGRDTSSPESWPEADSSGLKVLVIDDNRPAAETLSMALEILGHEVRTAFSGMEGIGIASIFSPDVIFLDLGMPGMDGCETARRIRESGTGKPLTLVALTGWGQDSVRRRTAESGFDHHLVKPADLQELRALLRGHVLTG